MSNRIKLVVFDIAGTTVKDNGEIAIAFADALKEFGYDVPKSKINPLMGYKKPEAIRIMVNEFEHDKQKVSEDYIDDIHRLFLTNMIAHYEAAEKLELLPNVNKLFTFLKSKEIKIGLDTGFSHDITEVIMRKLGWLKDGVVDYVVSSDEVPAGRPQPYMIQRMMEQAGIMHPLQVIKIGDTEVDVQEGKNAGCLYSIAVTTGAFSRQDLEPYKPSYILNDLIELLPLIEPLI